MNRPTVSIYQSVIDNAWVVHVDTDPDGEVNERGPTPLRVYVNDDGAPIYANPELPGPAA